MFSVKTHFIQDVEDFQARAFNSYVAKKGIMYQEVIPAGGFGNPSWDKLYLNIAFPNLSKRDIVQQEMSITFVNTYAISQMLSSFGGIYSLIGAASAALLSFVLYRSLKH